MSNGDGHDLVGHVDAFEDGVIKGWAGSLLFPKEATLVAVRDQGRLVAIATTEAARPDVEAVSGLSCAGFAIPIPFRFGKTFNVFIQCAIAGSTEWVEIGPAVSVPKIIGCVDTIDPLKIEGWAVCDPALQDTLTIGLEVDGVAVAETMTSLPRHDVARLYDAAPLNGFKMPVSYRYSHLTSSTFEIVAIVDGQRQVFGSGSFGLDGHPKAVQRFVFDAQHVSWNEAR